MKYITKSALIALVGATCMLGMSAAQADPMDTSATDQTGAPPTTQVNAPAAQPDAQTTRVESILGYTPDENGISFQVRSGGCTQKGDFKVQVEKRSARLAQLTLLRSRPDTCRSFVPTGERVYVTYSEMNLDPKVPFVLGNPNGAVQSFVWGQK